MPTLQTLGLPAIFSRDREGKNGTGAFDRCDRERQDHDAGCTPQRNQPNPIRACRHAGGSDRVRSRWRARRLSISGNSDTISRIIRADLRAALRQAPKVILVGEMRDRATVEVALMAAETGHLVLSTLHTVDAGQSINRILGLFSLGEEQQLRIRLADSFRYIVSQRLAPKVGGGRQLLTEIMGYNLRTRETIALGEGEQSQLLRNHRSEFALRLDDFRPVDPERLRSRGNQRRDRARLRFEERQSHPRDRPSPESSRDRQSNR